MLVGARQRNAAADVTGLLLHASGNFMQALEGEGDNVAAIYGVIKKCSLHSGIIEVAKVGIECRDYPDHPMAFRTVGARWIRDLDDVDPIVDEFESPEKPKSLAKNLLRQFWQSASTRQAGFGNCDLDPSSPY